MSRDQLTEDIAKRDPNSLGNLLVETEVIDEEKLEAALEKTALAKETGDTEYRIGDALASMKVKRSVIEQVADHQTGERLQGSSTHITAQVASANVAVTDKAIAIAERAIALATPKKSEPDV